MPLQFALILNALWFEVRRKLTVGHQETPFCIPQESFLQAKAATL